MVDSLPQIVGQEHTCIHLYQSGCPNTLTSNTTAGVLRKLYFKERSNTFESVSSKDNNHFNTVLIPLGLILNGPFISLTVFRNASQHIIGVLRK